MTKSSDLPVLIAGGGPVGIITALALARRGIPVRVFEAAGAVNTYPIAVLKQSQKPELARKFVDLVTSEAGQKVLTAAGFAKP